MENIFIFVGVVFFVLAGFIVYSISDFTSSSIPVITISVIMLIEVLFGILNILFIGTILIYIIILFLFLFVAKKNRQKLKLYFSSYSIIYILCTSIMILFAFSQKQMFYSEWDEISHWGPFCKNIFETNQFPMYMEYKMAHSSYPQGFQVLYYFFCIFLIEFNESSTYIVLLILMNVLMSCVFGVIEKKQYISGILLGSILATYLIIFQEFNLYSTIYLDGFVGIFFGSILIFFFYSNISDKMRYFCTVLILVAFTQIKTSALPIVLVSCGVYLAILINKYKKSRDLRLWTKIIVSFLSLVVIVLVAYKGWILLYNQYGLPDMTSEFSNNSLYTRMMDYRENGSESFISKITVAVIQGVRDKTLGNVRLISWLMGTTLVAIVLSFISFRKKEKKIKLLFWWIMPMSILFMIMVLYNIYMFKFPERRALVLGSFERYLLPLIIGWMMMAFSYLLSVSEKVNHKLQVVILSLSSIACLILFTRQDTNNYLSKDSGNDFTGRIRYKIVSEQITAYTSAGENMLVISQGNDGLVAYIYFYELLGKVKVFHPLPSTRTSYTTEDKVFDEVGGSVLYEKVSKTKFKEMISKVQADYILVNYADDILREGYGDLFDDGVNTGHDWDAKLYRVESDEELYQLVDVLYCDF